MKTIQPRKHRKRLHQNPLHRRYKTFSAPLAQNLRKTLNTKAMPLRTGDTIKLMRGDRKGVEGKVTQVNRKTYRIRVEGITKEKVDGTTVLFPIHPSKVQIIQLNRTDKWRRRILERKGGMLEKEAEAPEKQRDEKTEPSPVGNKRKTKKRKPTTPKKAPNGTGEKKHGEKRRKKTSKT